MLAFLPRLVVKENGWLWASYFILKGLSLQHMWACQIYVVRFLVRQKDTKSPAASWKRSFSPHTPRWSHCEKSTGSPSSAHWTGAMWEGWIQGSHHMVSHWSPVLKVWWLSQASSTGQRLGSLFQSAVALTLGLHSVTWGSRKGDPPPKFLDLKLSEYVKQNQNFWVVPPLVDVDLQVVECANSHNGWNTWSKLRGINKLPARIPTGLIRPGDCYHGMKQWKADEKNLI